MDFQHESIIIRNLNKLVDGTFCSNSFLSLFLQENVISKEDVEEIKLEETNRGRYAAAYKFYSMIVTKQNSYNFLINALQETKQSGVVELLTTSNSKKSNKLIKFNKPPLYAVNFNLQNDHRILIVFTTDCRLTCDKICDSDNTFKLVSLDETLTLKVEQKYTPVINCGKSLERPLYYINNVEFKCVLVTETEKLTDALGKTGNVDMNKVNVVHDIFQWNDLTNELQTKLLHDVKLQLCLEEDICKLALEHIDSLTLTQLINEETITYFKNTIPKQLSYYIPRQLIIRNVISETIFNEKGTDIFCFSGITDKDLPKFTKLSKSITSSFILKGHNLDDRFVILEEFDHFQQICNKFKTRSLHLIEYKDTTLIWKKSKGNITRIEQNLEGRQRLQTEVEFLDELICLQEKFHICILDSPGMGKSIVLAHLANELQKRTKHRTAFVIISEFLQQVKINTGTMTTDTAIEATLIRCLSANRLGMAYLHHNKHSVAELLFDGFDEIDPDDISLACNILKAIRLKFPKTRIWATTRSHLALELENTLETVGLNLAPFSEKDQVQFLTTYWNRSENTNSEPNHLKHFAQKCIENLRSSLQQEDLDIAGVPLQCQLIGDVFEEDALSFCLSFNANFEISSTSMIRIHSLIELYELVIAKKFDNFRQRYEKIITEELWFYNSHIDQSLNLVFPRFRNNFKTKLQHPLSIQDVLDVGFFISQDSIWTMRCIHRTFAEYFIAYFVVKTLKNECCDAMFSLILENILRTSSANVKIYNYHYIQSSKYNQHTICYFVNAMLKEKVMDDFKRKVVMANRRTIQRITEACLFGGFQSLFKNLLLEGILQSQLKFNIFQIKTLFLAVASKNGFIVDNVIRIFKSLHSFPLNKIQYSIENVGYTPLHVAIAQADYRTIELLVKQEGFEEMLRNKSIIFYITSWLKCNEPDDNVVDNNKIQIVKYLLSFTSIQPYIVTSSSVQIAEEALISSRAYFKENGVPVELLHRILQMEGPKQYGLLSKIYDDEDIDIQLSCQDKVESHPSDAAFLEQIFSKIKVEIQQISENISNSSSTSLDLSYAVVILKNREGLDKLMYILKDVTCVPNVTEERRLYFLKFGGINKYQVLINTNNINTNKLANLSKVIFRYGISLNMLSYYQVTPLVKLVQTNGGQNELDVFDLSKTFGVINPIAAIILRVKLLLSKYPMRTDRTNVEIRDIKNYNLLHIFLRRPNLNILERLLPFFIDLNDVNDIYETPLMILAQSTKFCFECWKILIDNGADVLAFSKTKTSICHLKSFQYKDSNVCLKALLYALNILSTCRNGKVETFVCLVVKSFSIAIVKCICEWYIATINKPIQDIKMGVIGGMTILDAVLYNIDGLVLEYVWKVHKCTKTSSPPTMTNKVEECMQDNVITQENRISYIILASEMFPDLVNTPNDMGMVPLASKHLQVPFINLLINNNADINATDMEGNTPLHWAIKHRLSVELVEKLLDCKADANAENLCYETPAICALDLSTDDDTLACLKILLRYGADLTKTYDNKNTILHLIPHRINLGRFYNFAAFFVENKLACMFSIENSDGNTPLEIVQELFYLDKRTIKLLLQNGVDVKRFSNFSSDSSSSESDSENSTY